MERKDRTASVIPVKARLKPDPVRCRGPSRGVPHVHASPSASAAACLVLLSTAAAVRKKEVLTGEEIADLPAARPAKALKPIDKTSVNS
jgi:hypothetical protein